MDNRPEMTANALRDWCRFSGTERSFIEPDSPWQNPFVESFGSRVRDEALSVEAFGSVLEAHTVITDWRTWSSPGRSYRCQVRRRVRPVGPAPQLMVTAMVGCGGGCTRSARSAQRAW